MVALSNVNSPRKIAGALVAGAVTSGLFASAGFGLAPTANATCASGFGIGSNPDCTSTLLSGSLAIGDGAQAHADGLFGAAFVVGNSTAATSSGSVLNLATYRFGDGNTVAAEGAYANWATNIGGNGNEFVSVFVEFEVAVPDLRPA